MHRFASHQKREDFVRERKLIRSRNVEKFESSRARLDRILKNNSIFILVDTDRLVDKVQVAEESQLFDLADPQNVLKENDVRRSLDFQFDGSEGVERGGSERDRRVETSMSSSRVRSGSSRCSSSR